MRDEMVRHETWEGVLGKMMEKGILTNDFWEKMYRVKDQQLRYTCRLTKFNIQGVGKKVINFRARSSRVDPSFLKWFEFSSDFICNKKSKNILTLLYL